MSAEPADLIIIALASFLALCIFMAACSAWAVVRTNRAVYGTWRKPRD